MNEAVLDFSSFICEGLRFDPDGHYEKRVNERINKVEINSLTGNDEAAQEIDIKDATFRCRHFLNKLALVSSRKLDLKSTAPASFYSISLGQIKLKTERGDVFVQFKAGDIVGEVFYGVAHNQVLKTLLLLPKNADSSTLARKGYSVMARDNRRSFNDDIESYKSRHMVYTVFDSKSVHEIDMTLDTERWVQEIDSLIGIAQPQTDKAEFSAAALEDVTLEKPYNKEMVLSPGTKITYLGKDGAKIEKTVNDKEPPAATTYKDKELTVFFEPQAMVVQGKKRMIASKKTFKKGDTFIVTPKNVTQSDLDQIRLATGEDGIELEDIKNAKFIGKITEIGQYSKEKYKSKFPVSYIRITGKRVLL